MPRQNYFTNQQMTNHAICAALIVAASIFSSFGQFQYIIDPFLIPFILVFFKLKKEDTSLLVTTMIAGVIIIFYKPRLILFFFAYMVIASSLYRLRGFFNFKNIAWLSLVYAFWFYLAYLITFLYIYGYKFNTFVSIFTGFSGAYLYLGIMVIIYEPILYSCLLILGKKYILAHYV